MILLDDFCPVVAGSTLYSGISLQVTEGEILPILGASGCGKTSLFNALRRLIPCAGQAHVDHDMIFSVFQTHDQLLPWYSNRRNLDLICQRAYHDIALRWQVNQVLDQYPDTVSVGQRQRLTLIRALCAGRSVLLCDEPLSAVDGITSLQIARDFRDMVRELGVCCLWITHDISEAKILNERVLVIQDGRCQIHDQSELETIFHVAA